jgi:hypothetical protein
LNRVIARKGYTSNFKPISQEPADASWLGWLAFSVGRM